MFCIRISSIFHELSFVCVCSRLETYSKLNEIDVDSMVAFKLKGNRKEALIRNIVQRIYCFRKNMLKLLQISNLNSKNLMQRSFRN